MRPDEPNALADMLDDEARAMLLAPGAVLHPPLVARLASAMAAAEHVVKTARNNDQNYMYASVEEVFKAVRGPLLEQAIVLTMRPVAFTEREVRSANNKLGTCVTADFDFVFTCGYTREEFVIPGWRSQGTDYGDKAYSKAITSGAKTFIKAQWLLPTEDDTEQDPQFERAAPNHWSWATMIDGPAKPAFMANLRALVGPDSARAIAAAGGEAYGGIPVVVADFALALRDVIAPASPPPSADDAPDVPPVDPAAPDLAPAAETPPEPTGDDPETTTHEFAPPDWAAGDEPPSDLFTPPEEPVDG